MILFWNNNPGLILWPSPKCRKRTIVNDPAIFLTHLINGCRVRRMLCVKLPRMKAVVDRSFSVASSLLGRGGNLGEQWTVISCFGVFGAKRGICFLPGVENGEHVGRWEMASQLGRKNLMTFYPNWKEMETRADVFSQKKLSLFLQTSWIWRRSDQHISLRSASWNFLTILESAVKTQST